MTSAIAVIPRRCSCNMPLSIWQYQIEERAASGENKLSIINDIGFEKMCCRKNLLLLSTPYVVDNMADMLVVEDRNGKIKRSRGWNAKANNPLPPLY